MVRICASEAIPDGQYRVADVGPVSIILARVGGRVHAVVNVCGHQSRRMDGGELVEKDGAACLICPHHAMCFDLKDGHIVEDAGHLNMEPIRALPSKEADGHIWVELPK